VSQSAERVLQAAQDGRPGVGQSALPSSGGSRPHRMEPASAGC